MSALGRPGNDVTFLNNFRHFVGSFVLIVTGASSCLAYFAHRDEARGQIETIMVSEM